MTEFKKNDLPVPEVLIDEKNLRSRIKELGKEITESYKGRHLTVIAVSNGATLFVADLIRQLDLPMQLDSIRAYSYEGSKSSGNIKIFSQIKLDVKGRDILLVDDILDTGRTMRKIIDYLLTLEPENLESCVLLDKPSRRAVKIDADYVGFEVPDVFVVGYGLDYNEYYRNLPYVGKLNSIE